MVFYNGPGSSTFGNIIINYYGTGYTPSFFCDGVWSDVGWDQTACENAIDARLAEPSYLDIDITVGGDENAGVVYYNITAEQDLQAGGLIRLLSAWWNPISLPMDPGETTTGKPYIGSPGWLQLGMRE